MNNNDQKFVRDSNSSLKLLAFQLSNKRELETIKYASASNTLVIMTVSLQLVELVPYFYGR